jgi:glycosyltransferase involved in cell wall biosynthesis
MKVSLVSTVKDAGPAIHEFLASLAAQTRPPDEVVIVDGGSSDGTLEALRDAPGLRVISEPGANIARGRNVAIATATHGVIAVTDADCTLAPNWLERLLVPLEHGTADVSAGFYLPVTSSFIQECIAATNMPDASEVGPGWMPSSRSVAFTRAAFDAAGGYPEWLPIGEDMYLNHRFVATGGRIEPATDAVVYWTLRPSLGATWRQYAGYARGDAEAGMYRRRHAARFAAYGLAAVAVTTRDRRLLALAALGGIAYARKPVLHGWRRMAGRPSRRWGSLATVPAVLAFLDAAKLWGYANELARSRNVGRRSPIGDPP